MDRLPEVSTVTPRRDHKTEQSKQDDKGAVSGASVADDHDEVHGDAVIFHVNRDDKHVVGGGGGEVALGMPGDAAGGAGRADGAQPQGACGGLAPRAAAIGLGVFGGAAVVAGPLAATGAMSVAGAAVVGLFSGGIMVPLLVWSAIKLCDWYTPPALPPSLPAVIAQETGLPPVAAQIVASFLDPSVPSDQKGEGGRSWKNLDVELLPLDEHGGQTIQIKADVVYRPDGVRVLQTTIPDSVLQYDSVRLALAAAGATLVDTSKQGGVYQINPRNQHVRVPALEGRW